MNRHQEILELLPWFVNGTLNEDEQSLVSDHLQQCPDCSREVEVLVETSQVFHTGEGRAEQAPGDARARFLERLNADDSGDTSAVGTGSASRPWLVPMALAACLLVAAVFIAPISRKAEPFEVLGNSTGPGAVVQVVFDPDTPEKRIRGLLRGDHSDIIGGPTDKGVYRLAVPEDRNVEQFLERLRVHPDVRFAELESSP